MNTEPNNAGKTVVDEKKAVTWATASIVAPLTGFILYKIAWGMQHGTPEEPATWTQWQAGRILFGLSGLFYLAALPCGLVALRRLPKPHAKRKLAWWGTSVGALALILLPIGLGKALLTSRAPRQASAAVASVPATPVPTAPNASLPTIDRATVEKATQIVQARMAVAHAAFARAVEKFESTNVLDLSSLRTKQDFQPRYQHLQAFQDAVRTWRYAPGAAQSWFYEELARLGAPREFRADAVPDFDRTYKAWGDEQRELCQLYDDLAMRTTQTLNSLQINWTPGEFKPGTGVPQFKDAQSSERTLKLLTEINGLREKIQARLQGTNQNERAAASTKTTARL